MKKRELERSGILVAPLALGGNVFGWTVDEPTAFGILDAFIDAGFSLIDTADVYSRWAPGNRGGESETIIDKWMRARGTREWVVLATKVGSEMGPKKRGLSKEHILHAAEASLLRLKTDYIDLYQSHYDDPAAPIEETLAAYEQLIGEGKVRVIGASNFTADRLRQSLVTGGERGLPRYETLQPLYNLVERGEYERTLAPVVREEKLGVLPYYSLAGGFLTGKYRSADDLSKSVRGQGVRKYLNERGLKILDALDRVAEDHHVTPASVAIAWLLTRPGVIAPIASATSVEQLGALIAGAKLELDRASIELLDKASEGSERAVAKTAAA